MTPVYINSSSTDQYNEHQFFSSTNQQTKNQFSSPNNSQFSSSSESLTCHLFFNPETHYQDRDYNGESHQLKLEGDNFGSQALTDHRGENQVDTVKNNDGLKFSLWKRETYDYMNDENQVKWMSSKMRVMLKMKKSGPTTLNSSQSIEVELEDHQNQKEPTSPPMEENANDSNSINSTSLNNNSNNPVRVCSDCNTTKTPLWRSGPQGPKSLCNACGIRQRKARKALMAAAAATAETGKLVFNDKPLSLSKATKILHKDHRKPNGHVLKYKKRQYSKKVNTDPSSSSSCPARKNCVEELLVRLRKNITFQRVFPQDEKEAAILLMALSCGYVHE